MKTWGTSSVQGWPFSLKSQRWLLLPWLEPNRPCNWWWCHVMWYARVVSRELNMPIHMFLYIKNKILLVHCIHIFPNLIPHKRRAYESIRWQLLMLHRFIHFHTHVTTHMFSLCFKCFVAWFRCVLHMLTSVVSEVKTSLTLTKYELRFRFTSKLTYTIEHPGAIDTQTAIYIYYIYI